MKPASFGSEAIAEFWQRNPCGADYVQASELADFFISYDTYKYATEPHIVKEIQKLDLAGKRVLEIGLGQGAEAQKLIEGGAGYNGIDLTQESVFRVKKRCELFALPYESISVMNAEHMTFPHDSFDVVFSHGVIHHSPRIQMIVREIHRVLRPGGIAVVMVYHRNSLNYHFSIRFIRRLGIFFLSLPHVAMVTAKLTGEPIERLLQHRNNLGRWGWGYLRMENFIHKATDGPQNVFSSVFSRNEAMRLFSDFHNVTTTCFFLNERHLPIVRTLLSQEMKERIASMAGWHLWIRGVK